MKESLKKKRQILRNNEYYNIQNTFDFLYRESKKNKKFTNLMQYITDDNNISLAYRNIKKNRGSKTPGTDNRTISELECIVKDDYLNYFKSKFKNYHPKSVRRVEIPKPNGKTRPLGIPCIDDRIIQQCIKQILEPICEAKFHKHSYGFRPNRSTSHAIARSMHLMNQNKLHYVVDIDIKGFFDNVNHSKLKKQLWSLGIQDKNLISIIGKILKSEIEGEGIPEKGTPQGGIISPLLSNIVLNELDWWLSSQWETFETKHDYRVIIKDRSGRPIFSNSNAHRELRKGNLKEVLFVRYADDFKIFCRDYKTALKIFHATKNWLKDRLGLEISGEKSKITNLRKNYTEFLGFKLKVKPKKGKYVCQSRMNDKAKKNTIKKIKEQIKRIQKCSTDLEVAKLNSIILGSHNYYNTATNCSLDFREINFLVKKTLETRLRHDLNDRHRITETYKRFYGRYSGKKYTVHDTTIYPIYGCKTNPPMNFSQEICNYTEEGRKAIHTRLKGYRHLIKYLLSTIGGNLSTEYNDNRISLIAGQKGKCYVTGSNLDPYNMECHHKIPKSQGGNDEYKNLVWVATEVHKLIHSTKKDTIKKYLDMLNLDEKGLKRVNSFRKLVGNSII